MTRLAILLCVALIGITKCCPVMAEQSPENDGASAGVYGQPGSPIQIERAPGAGADVSPNPEPYGPPMHDPMIFWHIIFDQLEGRTNGDDTGLRWEGEAWIGTDFNRLVLKTEGFYQDNEMDDGDQEVLYSRPIPRMRYFDWQAGLRYDLDSFPGRLWGAIGIEGLAPAFFNTAATFYVRDSGHVAGRLEASYDVLITNRLIAQPQIELNLYSKTDTPRLVGSGLSDIDTGLRIRYELSRKFAPYIGVAYNGKFEDTATLTRAAGESVDDVSFVFGMRLWY